MPWPVYRTENLLPFTFYEFAAILIDVIKYLFILRIEYVWWRWRNGYWLALLRSFCAAWPLRPIPFVNVELVCVCVCAQTTIECGSRLRGIKSIFIRILFAFFALCSLVFCIVVPLLWCYFAMSIYVLF